MAPKVLAYRLEGFSSENEVGCHSTIERCVRWLAHRSDAGWRAAPLQLEDLRDSTKGPSTSTSMESSRSPTAKSSAMSLEASLTIASSRVLVECLAAESARSGDPRSARSCHLVSPDLHRGNQITPDSVTVALQLGRQGCAGLRLFEGLAAGEVTSCTKGRWHRISAAPRAARVVSVLPRPVGFPGLWQPGQPWLTPARTRRSAGRGRPRWSRAPCRTARWWCFRSRFP